MKKYVAPNPNAAIRGQVMLAYEGGLEQENYLEILKQHNLETVDPEQWYPEQLSLDIQREIKSSKGGMQALVSIGMAVTSKAIFPPMGGVEQAVEAFTTRYAAGIRDIPPHERLHAEVIGDRKMKVVNATPHSDDMVYGYIFALVRRFAPAGSAPIVKFENYKLCDSDCDTVFYVTW